MFTLLIIISIVLLFIVGLLFFPFRIAVNTKKKTYYIALPGYFRMDLLFSGDYSPKLRLRLFFISFNIDPLKKKKRKDPEIKKAKESKEKTNKPKKQSLLTFQILAKDLLKSFKIKKFHAELDTGDFPLNAQLIPLAQNINNQNINLKINFNNRNSVDLLIVTRLFKFIRIVVKHYLLTK